MSLEGACGPGPLGFEGGGRAFGAGAVGELFDGGEDLAEATGADAGEGADVVGGGFGELADGVVAGAEEGVGEAGGEAELVEVGVADEGRPEAQGGGVAIGGMAPAGEGGVAVEGGADEGGVVGLVREGEVDDDEAVFADDEVVGFDVFVGDGVLF